MKFGAKLPLAIFRRGARNDHEVSAGTGGEPTVISSTAEESRPCRSECPRSRLWFRGDPGVVETSPAAQTRWGHLGAWPGAMGITYKLSTPGGGGGPHSIFVLRDHPAALANADSRTVFFSREARSARIFVPRTSHGLRLCQANGVQF